MTLDMRWQSRYDTSSTCDNRPLLSSLARTFKRDTSSGRRFSCRRSLWPQRIRHSLLKFSDGPSDCLLEDDSTVGGAGASSSCTDTQYWDGEIWQTC